MALQELQRLLPEAPSPEGGGGHHTPGAQTRQPRQRQVGVFLLNALGLTLVALSMAHDLTLEIYDTQISWEIFLDQKDDT